MADAFGPRTSIDLIAPGWNVRTQIAGDVESPDRDGTSFAAPHVTATTALLHEYYEQQRVAGSSRFDRRHRSHQVMKAVLLNSADKLAGVHDSERTVLRSNGEDWTTSPASSPFIPLDIEIGAGHLNARRALDQLIPGEHDPGTVPSIGWDWERSGGSGETYQYVFEEDFAAGQYFAATLAYDRKVRLTNPDGRWVAGDTFFNYNNIDEEIANFDLKLELVGGPLGDTVIDLSINTDNTVEHLFTEIPTAGTYRLTVERPNSVVFLDDQTDFGLAWWYGSAKPLRGDYDDDGDVDQDDYTEWSNNYGDNVTPWGTGADGNGDGRVNSADYSIWRDAFRALPSSSTVAVPEPSSAALLLIAVALLRRRA